MMRQTLTASLCLSWVFAGNSQTVNPVTPVTAPALLHRAPRPPKAQKSAYPEDRVIENLMLAPQAFYQGAGEPQLHRMGDATASAEIRVLSSKPLTDQQITLALDILHKSFEDLDAVGPADLRTPKAALFLLSHFALIANGDETKQKVEATRQFVLNAKPVVTR